MIGTKIKSKNISIKIVASEKDDPFFIFLPDIHALKIYPSLNGKNIFNKLPTAKDSPSNLLLGFSYGSINCEILFILNIFEMVNTIIDNIRYNHFIVKPSQMH